MARRLVYGALAGLLAAMPAMAQDTSGYTLFDPTPDDQLRPFDSDRPTRSDTPYSVDAGHFQYETDLFLYTHSNAGGAITRSYTGFDPVLKLGLTDNIELGVQFTGYTWLDANGPAAGETTHAQGAGDVILRPKFNLFGNQSGPAMALIPYVKFATAAPPIGDGHTDGGVIAPISFPLPWKFTLLVMPEVDVITNAADSGHHFNFTQLVNLSHPVGKGLTLYGELYSALGTDARTPPAYTFDAALEWMVRPALQLDVGANVGLNRNAPDLQLYMGLAQRF